MEPQISDDFGRRFPYLRLSITDVCNFRCSYCLPDGYKPSRPEGFMSREEIGRLAAAFAGLGVWKIRLTGGEPTIRPDFIDIAQDVAATQGVTHLAFTTNGYKLKERAQSYFQAGLRAINVSVDSLSPKKFEEVTGHDRLKEIMDGIDECRRAGFQKVKINTVLLKGINDQEIDDFIDFVADKSLSLRFIELMQTGDNRDYFSDRHLPGAVVTQRLHARGWKIQPRQDGAGPAVEFAHEDSTGTIGLIAPYSKDFCATCNRLRVSARGNLHLCLFGENGYSLRDLLQSDDQRESLQQKILSLMRFKKSSHFLQDGNTGATPHLASIGG
jgi:cyclic pyranopterin phosphate synthase